MQVIRRDGTRSEFDRAKIAAAVARAFLATQGGDGDHAAVIKVVDEVVAQLDSYLREGVVQIHIEVIQDAVQVALVKLDHHQVELAYRLYRAARTEQRGVSKSWLAEDGTTITIPYLTDILARVACRLPEHVREHLDLVAVAKSAFLQTFNGIDREVMYSSLILSARTFIETAPEYSKLAAQLLVAQAAREVWGLNHAANAFPSGEEYAYHYANETSRMLHFGISDSNYVPELAHNYGGGGIFDHAALIKAIKPERDLQFDYLGLQTLYDRYFVREAGVGHRIEMPQTFFLRVAMGLALRESDPTAKAIEFYDLLSSFDYMASTPTLFNAGTLHSQMSSCYLTTIPDDLGGIYDGIKDNALLSKFAGGLGNDWTPVRALGSLIKGTNGKSQGVIPFLKVVNDTAVAVNQGGKRKGAVCAYLETWHLDIEDFAELRKNTGDERRRTHDMNTANWVPDLFMDRVEKGGTWTLFSPSDVPDLHDKYGEDFREAYEAYEKRAAAGEFKSSKVVDAVTLWRKLLSMVFETGHPWITFKDPCNIRNPQQHVGVVHSSNLCTEITLNTKASSPDAKDGEHAVCNLGSINLARHLIELPDGGVAIDAQKLQRTVSVAMRVLDNVIDLNYYPTVESRNSNMRHRPVGLGVMGFQDVLYIDNVSYDSDKARRWAGMFQQLIAYYALSASCDLAEERGAYESFDGSLWSHGILPFDSFRNQTDERERQGFNVELAWEAYDEAVEIRDTLEADGFIQTEALRERIKASGLRNSNTMAIAPTATISNIVGVTQSIEPTFEQVFVKDNLSGNFTITNKYLVDQLRKHGLWDQSMINKLKLADGSIQGFDEIPAEVRQVYRNSFEYEPDALIDAAIQRQIPMDQAQSLNLYMMAPSGKKLDTMYRRAWYRGLKTTYYLRGKAASKIEKSVTGAAGGSSLAKTTSLSSSAHSALAGAVASVGGAVITDEVYRADARVEMPEPEGAACMLRPGDPGFSECEACQ